MDENEQALAELAALLNVPGALRIVTNEVVPALRRNGDDPTSRVKAGKEALLTDPATFVQHTATRIETVEHRGTVRVHSEEGDWVEGQPAAVLKRLREWRG